MKLLVRLLIATIIIGALALLAYAIVGPGRLLGGNQEAVGAPTSRPSPIARATAATPTPRPSHSIPAPASPTWVAQPTRQASTPHPRATPTIRSTGQVVVPRRVPGVPHSEPRQATGQTATVTSGPSGSIPRPTSVPATQAPVAPSTPTPNPNVPTAMLSIPRLGIHAPVYDRGIDATGQLPIAHGYSVTHYLFSAPLGGVGNYVIYGHDDIEGSIFRYLPNLQIGDFIYLTSGARRVTYQVTRSFVVTPDQVWVMKPTSTATLTAISCVPYGIDTHRIIVKAKLVSEQQV
ncbi:MAG TPA: sortase [Chloroflexota bacterium]|nr:sortase [Chloroflexota bacterium]